MIFDMFEEGQQLHFVEHLLGWGHIIYFENNSRSPFLDFKHFVNKFDYIAAP